MQSRITSQISKESWSNQQRSLDRQESEDQQSINKQQLSQFQVATPNQRYASIQYNLQVNPFEKKGTGKQANSDTHSSIQAKSQRNSSKDQTFNKSQKKVPYDFSSHNVEVLENGELRFKDIREEILTKKVDKALFKVQQIENQKYAIKLLGLKHFFLNIARFTNSSMNKNLSKFQKTVIKDLCLPENNSSSGNGSNSHMRMSGNRDEDDQKLTLFERIVSQIPLFNPSNTFLIVWDIFQLIFIIFFFYAIPLQLVFNLGIDKFMTETIFSIGIALFLVDNFLCVNTTYFEKGVPVKDRHLILNHYLRKHFITDFLSNIPVLIDYFFFNLKGIWGLLMLMQYLKVDRIKIIIRKVEERFNLSLSQQQLVCLAKLLFRVLFVAHIFSCIWLYLALYNEDDSQVWLNKFDYNLKSWSEQFLVSYYFTTVTMITVGYGDFVPLNNREFVFCIFTMLIACGVFAYAVNQIGSIFENIGRQEKQMKEMMYSISSYMHLKKVSKELQYQIREYLQYYWTEQQDRDTDVEEKIKNLLSDNLKDMLALEANNIVLKDSVVFKNNFSNPVISKTVPLIKEYRATPEEIILMENTLTEDQNIYFIEKGQVEVYLSQSDQPLKIQQLNAGDCFGQVGFFTGLSRILSVRSLDFTTLIYVKRSEFIDLVKEYPEDYEQFCYIRDKILNESDFRLIGMRCYSCKDGKHLSHNCPFLHYTPKKFALLKKCFYPGHQNREKWFRKKINKTVNCLKETDKLKDKAEEIQEQYSMIIDDLFGDEDLLDSDEDKQYDSDLNNLEGDNESQSQLVSIPSYLIQNHYAKKLSIENQNHKFDESCQQSDESGSNRKINLPQNQSFAQSFVITDNNNKDENISQLQMLNQTSFNFINDNKFLETSNNNFTGEGDSVNLNGDISSLPKSSHLIPQKEMKKKTISISKREVTQTQNSGSTTKEILNSPYILPTAPTSSNQNIPLPNQQPPQKFENKTSRQMSRSESRRKSTKKQLVQAQGIISSAINALLSQQVAVQGVKGFREDSQVSRQLSSQTSKFEVFNKQGSKQKFVKQPTIQGKKDSGQFRVNQLGHDSSKHIMNDINPGLLFQKLMEMIGGNQDTQRRGSYDQTYAVIEGSDNINNFYGLEDFDSIKNYTFYYPISNAEYVLEKLMNFQKHKVRNPNFMQLNKLKPNVQVEKVVNHQVDIIRKTRKTGGTRIIAGGGVTGNLINKFRQQEEAQGGSQEIDSLGGTAYTPSLSINNSVGDGSPFQRSNVRKATKRQNIVSSLGMPQQLEPTDSSKDSPNELNKNYQNKKSKFQLGQPNSIEEEENEENENDKMSFSTSYKNNDISKASSRHNILDEFYTSMKVNPQEKQNWDGNTFSHIPSVLSISENGNLPQFQNLQFAPPSQRIKNQENILFSFQ